MRAFKQFTRTLPTLATAVLLALAVWILAVTSTDPVERRAYGRPVELEIVGEAPGLIITSELPEQATLVLSAPASVWQDYLSTTDSVRTLLDLTALDAGTYKVPVKVQVNTRPVKVENVTPDLVSVTLEKRFSKEFDITFFQPSSAAVGYEAGKPQLGAQTATVNGPESLVQKVHEVRAALDISQSKESIDREVTLTAIDKNGVRVQGVSISPEKIRVQQSITQRGGYKNMTVKVITSGQIASGYRLTNISANPLVVTLFSTDPDLIATLPGFIETQPLNLAGADDDLDVFLPLNVPSGAIVVGESTIKVSVAISPIEGSVTLNSLPIELVGVTPQMQAILSPDRVDVILSGPIPELDKLRSSEVRVLLDLTDKAAGVYQIEPQIQVGVSGILVESILPATIEVELFLTPTPAPVN